MRLSTRRPLLFLCCVVLSACPTLALPVDPAPVQSDAGGLTDLLGGSASGNLTKTVDDLIGDATSVLTSFIGAIQEFYNATHENDLVDLLGVDLQSNTEDDQASVTSSTVGEVGANATCPGMAVLFARGTAEVGK